MLMHARQSIKSLMKVWDPARQTIYCFTLFAALLYVSNQQLCILNGRH